MEEKYIEYANIIMENLDIEPKLNEILIKIEGRKLNKTIIRNNNRRWELARELGTVKTTQIKQGEISAAFADGIIKSMKKKNIIDMLK